MIKASEITKRQSLEQSAILYRWCQAHPDKGKSECPIWDDWDCMPVHYCPLCEYAFNQHPRAGYTSRIVCRDCPLFGKWGRYKRCFTEKGNGLFDLWNDAEEMEDRIKYAGEIAELCEKELREIGE